MPWNETSPMKERIRLLADQRSGLYTVTELCERFGISRKTGYKWIDRFEEEEAAGLADRPHAPRRATSAPRWSGGTRGLRPPDPRLNE